ncbi:MAG: Ig-like domain-containing domain, partial [Bacteroidia bacterium]
MRNGLYALLWLYLASCASRVAPSGGKPDNVPPKIVSINPQSGSTSFSGNRIEIEFDEFIALKDGGSGIVVSPPLNTPPESVLKGKVLQLKFKEALRENVTYSITLGKSVIDITESNPLEETQLVFATGAVLDTLKVNGRVENAFSNAAPKTAVIALYEAFHDSVPQAQLPRYFTRTDAAGNFTINNIKAGKYRILAFEDANSDLKWNNPDEPVAFANDTLAVDSGITSIGTLRLFKEKLQRQRLVRSKYDAPGRITLKYALAPEKLQFETLGAM